jgi:hypothetical protein
VSGAVLKEYAKYISTVCLFLLKKEGDVTYVLLQQRKNKKYTNGW